MDQKKAMDLLQISGETSLDEAEARYRDCCDELRQRHQAGPADLAAQQQLDIRLEELAAAIGYLRRPKSSVERAGAAMLASYARQPAQALAADGSAQAGAVPATEQAPATFDRESRQRTAPAPEAGQRLPPNPEVYPVEGDASREPAPEPAPAASNKPGAGKRTALLAGLAGLLSAAVLGWIFILQPDPGPTIDSSEPAPSTPVMLPGEPVIPNSEWEAAREQLTQRREDLAGARSTPVGATDAEEWRTLIDRHIFDAPFMVAIDRHLATAAPADFGSQAAVAEIRKLNELTSAAERRLTELDKLKEALLGRKAMDDQVKRLRAGGLPEWPVPTDRIPTVFPSLAAGQVEQLTLLARAARDDLAAGRFELAAQAYRELVAGLVVLEQVLSEQYEKKERELDGLYQRGLEAISRFHLSRPAAGSALFYVAEIERLEPGRVEAARLRRAIQEGYIGLLSAELARGNKELAAYYARLAVEMGAAPGLVDDAYAGGVATPD
jgi:hypothetical protein